MSEADQWREFQSEDKRQNADTGENLNENATVWLRTGKVVGANFTFQSPSRDWAHFVMYYFREDGGLSKLESRLNTFYGNVSVIREMSYNSKGKLLRNSTKCFDLYSQKPKRCTNTSVSIPVFRSVRNLPFYKLL